MAEFTRVMVSQENRDRLGQVATVVYLFARPLILHRRITADPASPDLRPPLTGLDPLQEVEVLLRQRDPLYRGVATLTVDTSDLALDEITSRIQATLAP